MKLFKLNLVIILFIFCNIQFAKSQSQTGCTNEFEYSIEPFWTEENYIPPTKSTSKGVMNVTNLKQFGENWSGDQLGFCSNPLKTIESHGCALTCVAMVMSTGGTNIDPGELNTWLIGEDCGYYDGSTPNAGCDINWGSINGYQNVTVSYLQTSIYSLNIIRDEIDGGNPVIAGVNTDADPYVDHWVLIKGYDEDGTEENHFLVSDPGITALESNWSDYQIAPVNAPLRLYEVGYNFPAADFTADNTTINVGQSINFTDLTTDNPTDWLWTFEGGEPETSTEQNPTITYNSAGTFRVTLIASNDNGRDAEIKQNYITVSTPPPPIADFSADNTTILEEEVVNFQDLSTNNPTSWSWTFDGGSPASSTAQNPTVTYNTEGTYDVSLTSTNAGGSDTETEVDYITVSIPTPPGAGFSADNTTILEGGIVNFQDESTNDPTSWSWTFDGGTPASPTVQNPSVTYNTPGTYDVSLTVTNADGSDTETKPGYIQVNHPGVTVSGSVKDDNYISLSYIPIIAVGSSGPFSTTTDDNGNFELNLPYGWSGTITADGGNYYTNYTTSSHTFYSNYTFSPFILYIINLQIIVTLESGNYYKLEADGAPIGTISYSWNFGDDYTSPNNSLWWEYHFFECFTTHSEDYTISLTITTEDGEEISTNTNINIPQCVDVMSDAYFTMGCSSIPVGGTAKITDISYPFSDISRVRIWWDEGSWEIWDTENCPGSSLECNHQDHFLYTRNCKIFHHTYYTPGHYAISLEADNLIGINTNNKGMGFNVVDCDISINASNLSSAYYFHWNNIYWCWAGNYDLNSLSAIPDYNNKNIEISACNKIVLMPGLSAAPEPGKKIVFKIDECLHEGNKSEEEEEYYDWEFEDIYFIADCHINNETDEINTEIYENNDTIRSMDLMVYPNPNSGRFILKVVQDFGEIEYCEIFNATGKVVQIIKNIQNNEYEFDISSYSKGIYFMKVLYENKIEFFKIIYNN